MELHQHVGQLARIFIISPYSIPRACYKAVHQNKQQWWCRNWSVFFLPSTPCLACCTRNIEKFAKFIETSSPMKSKGEKKNPPTHKIHVCCPSSCFCCLIYLFRKPKACKVQHTWTNTRNQSALLYVAPINTMFYVHDLSNKMCIWLQTS